MNGMSGAINQFPQVFSCSVKLLTQVLLAGYQQINHNLLYQTQHLSATTAIHNSFKILLINPISSKLKNTSLHPSIIPKARKHS